MLLQPGSPYEFNGRHDIYPDIKLIYWAGGNPFHHHQDLNRLRKAWPTATLVHTPVHASWLNQCEIYFSVVQRKVLPRWTPKTGH